MIALGLDEWFCDMKILECYTGMIQSYHLQTAQQPMYLMMSRASFASEASTTERNSTGYWFMCWNCSLRLFLKLVWWYFALNLLNAEAVKELYDKMLDSVVVKRSMPPNAWLWSLLENCKNHDDIKLLFDILEKLRRFVSFCCFLIITPFIIFNLTCKVLFLGKLDTLSKGLEPMISSSILFLLVGPWGTFHLSYSLLPVWSIELEWLIADRSTLLAAETFKSSYSWEF